MSIAKELKEALQQKEKTSAYDTQATVTRVENGTAWVHIPGGVAETPVKMTINVIPGDDVNVHVENGSAWITGNASAPPTDDRTANISMTRAAGAIEAAAAARSKADDAIISANGKNKVFHQVTQPQETAGLTEGDTWFDTSDDNAIHKWNGTEWVSVQLGDDAIADLSASKLTAGTIDASKITVTNLNASNINAGKLTVGGVTIDVSKNESVIDGAAIEDGTITLSGLSQEVTDKIDGAIETFTGTVTPTLNNSPASSWTTDAIRKTHIGDVYYVVNAASQADGYCYRFAYDNSASAYSWVLIKDSDVTKALQELIDVQGDVSDLQTFESETNSWIEETDEELSSLKTRTTNVETSLGNKVDTSTFNTVSQKVDENSANITSLTNTVSTKADSSTVTTLSNTVNEVKQTADSNTSKISNLTTVLGTNADGTTKANDIVHKQSALEQDLDGFKTTVSSTYETKANAAVVNLLPSVYYRENESGKSWTNNGITWTVNNDGSVTATGTATATSAYALTQYTLGYTVPVITLDPNKRYTLSGCPAGGSTTTYRMYVRCTPAGTAPSSSSGKLIFDYGTGVTTKDSYKYIAVILQIINGYTCPTGGITFYPQLEVGDTVNGYVSTHNGTGALANRVSTAESNITQNANNIELKVSKDGVISAINQTAESVTIDADKINLNGAVTANNYFKINTDGSMEATNATFSGEINADSGSIAIFTITDNYITSGPTSIDDGDNVGIFLGQGGFRINGGAPGNVKTLLKAMLGSAIDLVTGSIAANSIYMTPEDGSTIDPSIILWNVGITKCCIIEPTGIRVAGDDSQKIATQFMAGCIYNSGKSVRFTVPLRGMSTPKTAKLTATVFRVFAGTTRTNVGAVTLTAEAVIPGMARFQYEHSAAMGATGYAPATVEISGTLALTY